jgi:hypothetical protein
MPVKKLKDMKESLGGVKPDLTHVRRSSMIYETRAKEYGSFKYERANYLRGSADIEESVERLRTYIRGAISHWMLMLDSIEDHQAEDPNFENLEELLMAIYAPDTEVGKDGTPASGLPHACGALASGAMGVTIMVKLGLLPEDPGQPWNE